MTAVALGPLLEWINDQALTQRLTLNASLSDKNVDLPHLYLCVGCVCVCVVRENKCVSDTTTNMTYPMLVSHHIHPKNELPTG